LPIRFIAPMSAVVVASLFWPVIAQAQDTPADAPTFRVTSQLVVLDVTVLDKNGRPVVKGLTKDDFTITDGDKQQRILSFEPPQVHVLDKNAVEDDPGGKAPMTIFVLDLLNSTFEDFAYIRYEIRRYLDDQPARLKSPAELMVLGNRSLEMMQDYTTSKKDLLSALQHIPAALPFKLMNPGFAPERFAESLEALQQIALQNKGIPGRKNIVWVGHGAPGMFLSPLPSHQVTQLVRYLHDTTNMLVDSRLSLFVIYPGLPVTGIELQVNETGAFTSTSHNDPFSGDINFAKFVSETGGTLFYNRNDVDREIKLSQERGSEYYTLSYSPDSVDPNGKFRHIRVTLRNPQLRALTKAGYYAPDQNAAADPRSKALATLADAMWSTVPFTAFNMRIADIVRHPDTGTIDFTLKFYSKHLVWKPGENGGSTTNVMFAAASLNSRRHVLASNVQSLSVSARSREAGRLGTAVTTMPVTLRLPRKTQSVRVVLEAGESGTLGAFELDHKSLDAAPEAPTPVAVSHAPAAVGSR